MSNSYVTQQQKNKIHSHYKFYVRYESIEEKHAKMLAKLKRERTNMEKRTMTMMRMTFNKHQRHQQQQQSLTQQQQQPQQPQSSRDKLSLLKRLNIPQSLRIISQNEGHVNNNNHYYNNINNNNNISNNNNNIIKAYLHNNKSNNCYSSKKHSLHQAYTRNIDNSIIDNQDDFYHKKKICADILDNNYHSNKSNNYNNLNNDNNYKLSGNLLKSKTNLSSGGHVRSSVNKLYSSTTLNYNNSSNNSNSSNNNNNNDNNNNNNLFNNNNLYLKNSNYKFNHSPKGSNDEDFKYDDDTNYGYDDDRHAVRDLNNYDVINRASDDDDDNEDCQDDDDDDDIGGGHDYDSSSKLWLRDVTRQSTFLGTVSNLRQDVTYAEKQQLLKTLENMKRNISTTSATAATATATNNISLQRRLKTDMKINSGVPFLCKPATVIFKSFNVGLSYVKRVRLTNVTSAPNSCHFKTLPIKSTPRFPPPKQLPPGISCYLTVYFTPNISVSDTDVDFGEEIAGEIVKKEVSVCNDGDYEVDVAIERYVLQSRGTTETRIHI
ncbi:hypothetical protein HELRODRAFT_172425 [Helobdella robusta]|uniref:Uncharacterized protein n=1 Tax=Helobdella robusta TaxID=6412 RepID=T1F5B2_HELRO|nr:hypothetical protein HELRODRAFT_172425 [Helobdella robusta]ESO04752.1 hypothetical protein HELRODRAFT_172425 [Helobdella robusta]